MKRITKTKEYLELESFIASELKLKYSTLLERFNSVFCKESHYLTISWRFYIPNLLTKDKKVRVNMRSGDLSNIVKPIEDAIFMHFTNADDSHVIAMNVEKIQSKDYRVEVDIQIKDLHAIL